MSTQRRRPAPRAAPRRAIASPKPRAIRGRGSYNIDATYKKTKAARKVAKRQPDYEPSFGRTLLTEGGSMLGGIFGMPGLGGKAGGALSNIFGLGSYEIKENVFMEGRLPQMMNIPSGGGTIIRFQEYLGDVITSATPGSFDVKNWVINAANRDTFPFLSQIAANYEQYQMEGLVFEFRSTSADALNSTNTALGSVIMATQYDVADAAFGSKAEMLNYEYSNSVKPSESCMHMIECAPTQTSIPLLYTLDGDNPANTDARLYHLGRFNIATIGFQAASVRIGEIHCTYQVRLLKPKIYSALGLDNDFYYQQNSSYTNALVLGNGTATVNDNFGCSNTSNAITLPSSSLVKYYRIIVNWAGVGTIVIANSAVTYANCTQQNIGYYPVSGTSTQQASAQISIKTDGNNLAPVITFAAATLPTPGLVSIRVMEVPNPL